MKKAILSEGSLPAGLSCKSRVWWWLPTAFPGVCWEEGLQARLPLYKCYSGKFQMSVSQWSDPFPSSYLRVHLGPGWQVYPSSAVWQRVQISWNKTLGFVFLKDNDDKYIKWTKASQMDSSIKERNMWHVVVCIWSSFHCFNHKRSQLSLMWACVDRTTLSCYLPNIKINYVGY